MGGITNAAQLGVESQMPSKGCQKTSHPVNYKIHGVTGFPVSFYRRQTGAYFSMK